MISLSAQRSRRMPTTRGACNRLCNRLEATMLKEEHYGHHVSDDGLEKLLNDHGRTMRRALTASLERQNAELRARNDLLEEEIRQIRKTLAPRLLFPLGWHLNRGETSVLACLYTSPDGFRSSAILKTCAEIFSADSDGAKVVSVRIFNLRNKLRAFGIRILTRHGEGYILPPEFFTRSLKRHWKRKTLKWRPSVGLLRHTTRNAAAPAQGRLFHSHVPISIFSARIEATATRVLLIQCFTW